MSSPQNYTLEEAIRRTIVHGVSALMAELIDAALPLATHTEN